ncbi:MAG: flagellar protein [Clostridiales bacterium]|jgi:hypothetical protein|nr:flagellar protein [Clostridiales bacterium]
MDVRNCKECGKLFNYISGPPLCPACKRKLEDIFEKVKEYIYDHPRVGIQEVSEEFNISVALIKQWIREERLAFAEDSMIGIDCELCGALIKTGRYCKACKVKLARKLQELYPSQRPVVNRSKDYRENAKMRFLDPDRNNDK